MPKYRAPLRELQKLAQAGEAEGYLSGLEFSSDPYTSMMERIYAIENPVSRDLVLQSLSPDFKDRMNIARDHGPWLMGSRAMGQPESRGYYNPNMANFPGRHSDLTRGALIGPQALFHMGDRTRVAVPVMMRLDPQDLMVGSDALANFDGLEMLQAFDDYGFYHPDIDDPFISDWEPDLELKRHGIKGIVYPNTGEPGKQGFTKQQIDSALVLVGETDPRVRMAEVGTRLIDQLGPLEREEALKYLPNPALSLVDDSVMRAPLTAKFNPKDLGKIGLNLGVGGLGVLSQMRPDDAEAQTGLVFPTEAQAAAARMPHYMPPQPQQEPEPSWIADPYPSDIVDQWISDRLPETPEAMADISRREDAMISDPKAFYAEERPLGHYSGWNPLNPLGYADMIELLRRVGADMGKELEAGQGEGLMGPALMAKTLKPAMAPATFLAAIASAVGLSAKAMSKASPYIDQGMKIAHKAMDAGEAAVKSGAKRLGRLLADTPVTVIP